MILQNKQTGVLGVLEATTYHGGRPDNIIEVYEMGMGAVKVLAQYKTLEELLGEWKDYKPKDPLIKDEKIRKAVRAWAEANEYNLDKGLDYTEYVGNYGCSFATYGSDDNEIHFCKKLGLEDGRDYTIAELCGEGEE